MSQNMILLTKIRGVKVKEDISIYIHIPFCIKKCFYCDFVSFENKDEMIDVYVDALCHEILNNSEILSQYNIKTIYIGGGTPSFIDSKYIAKIMQTLNLFIPDKKILKEVTIEVNPNSITLEKLNDYYNLGINRLSIGLQSTHDKILRNIGRQHTFADFKKTLEYAKDANFSNISVDLIYPLPGLNKEMFKESLNSIIKLKYIYNIKHISVYNLEVHENTKLAFLLNEGYLSLCSEEEEYEMRSILNKTLEDNGYNKYEISNYAIKGYESKHNLCYWNQEKYLGFGVNASSFFNLKRYKNSSNIEQYIQKSNNFEDIVIESEELDKLALMKEYVILKLRLTEGIKISDFKEKFNIDIFDIFKSELSSLENDKLIIIDRKLKSIYLSSRGEEVANIVWERFV